MSNQFVNEDIYAKKVILIDATGRRVGEVLKYDAIRQAKEQGLDLVQIQPGTHEGFPLCKILDYGKMKYEQSKQKITNKVLRDKEILFHLGTSSHDLNTKKNRVKDLLEKGHRVRFGLELRRREKQFMQNAKTMLEQNVADFSAVARWDDIKASDRFVFVNLQPIRRTAVV